MKKHPPGSQRRCRYFLDRRCLRDELLNPGYHKALRCVRLEAYMAEWDDFIDRAGAFQLTMDEAATIWENRKHPAFVSPGLCPVCPVPLESGEQGSPVHDCRYLHDTACLLAMPDCAGPCELWQGRK